MLIALDNMIFVDQLYSEEGTSLVLEITVVPNLCGQKLSTRVHANTGDHKADMYVYNQVSLRAGTTPRLWFVY